MIKIIHTFRPALSHLSYNPSQSVRHKSLLTSLLVIFFLTITACGGGGSGETKNSNVLSPPSGSVVSYNFITIQVANKFSGVKAKNLTTDSIDQIGIKYTDSFFIYDVPLQGGINNIQITSDDDSIISTLKVDYKDQGFAPIELKLAKNKGFSNLTTNATITHNSFKASKYYIDVDGDKLIDIETTTPNIELNFPAIGSYHPRIIVKTTNNILYSGSEQYSTNVNVIENPTSNTKTVAGIDKSIVDMEKYGQHIYALTDSNIIKISISDTQDIEIIDLFGYSNPQGFTLDNEGNIYIADTDANRVIKLLASNNYQQDNTFNLNTSGSEKGELLSPVDVTTSNQGNKTKIYVLDAGNNRIQVFNFVGAYLADFDGSNTPEGKLNSPINMIGAPNLIISDFGNKILRKISYNDISQTETGENLLSLTNFGKVSFSSDGLLITDKEKQQLLFLKIDGEIKDTLPAKDDIGEIAIAYEQNHQMLYAPKNSTSLQHVVIPKTPTEASPTALSKKFVDAYLNDDKEKMLNYSTNEVIDKLNAIQEKVKNAFNNMKSYDENIYAHGLNAVVTGKSTVSIGDVKIKFYFIWKDDKWTLNDVI